MNMTNKTGVTPKGQAPGEKLILPGTTIGGGVGTFYMDFAIWSRDRTRSRTLNGLVDTGASYTQIPASILDELGIERERTRVFTVADGSKRELSVGWVRMELQGQSASVYIIFGDAGSSILLGAIALETFGLAADATIGRLIPGELTL